MSAEPDAESQRRRAEQRRGDDDPDAGLGEADRCEVPGEHHADDPVAERSDPPGLQQDGSVMTSARREDAHSWIFSLTLARRHMKNSVLDDDPLFQVVHIRGIRSRCAVLRGVGPGGSPR